MPPQSSKLFLRRSSKFHWKPTKGEHADKHNPTIGTSMTLSPKWQKAEALSKIIAAMILPIFLILAAFGFDSVLKNRDLKANNFELAVGILQNDRTLVDDSVWEWAIATFKELAIIPPNEKAQSILENTGFYAEPVAEFLSQELRTWLKEDYENRQNILSTWLNKNSISVGPMLFMIHDQYAKQREQFLNEQGAWK